jgi:hypothetical protein
MTDPTEAVCSDDQRGIGFATADFDLKFHLVGLDFVFDFSTKRARRQLCIKLKFDRVKGPGQRAYDDRIPGTRSIEIIGQRLLTGSEGTAEPDPTGPRRVKG